MEAYIVQYFFINWVDAVQCFLVEPFNINIQVLVRILSVDLTRPKCT